jgi:ankyrin repeat protein
MIVENVSELSVCVSLIDAIRGNDQVKLNDILNKNITKFHLKPSTGNFSPIDQRKDFFSPQFGNLLHLAASFGNRHTCQQFIANGISINATDKKGNTPLHRAAIAGRHDIVDYLLKEDNIDDTIRNGVGKTALDLCKTKECISTFERMFSYMTFIYPVPF